MTENARVREFVESTRADLREQYDTWYADGDAFETSGEFYKMTLSKTGRQVEPDGTVRDGGGNQYYLKEDTDVNDYEHIRTFEEDRDEYGTMQGYSLPRRAA